MPPMDYEDEGYPVSREVDGTDTKKIANREGFQSQLGRPLNCHRDWSNSKTGKKTEPPEYARDDY